MARTVGLVTIGQAPRPDLAEEYEHALAGAAIIQVGALDDLSEADVLGLSPAPGDDVLVSRLRTGREVRLSRRHLEPRLQLCLDRLQRDARNGRSGTPGRRSLSWVASGTRALCAGPSPGSQEFR